MEKKGNRNASKRSIHPRIKLIEINVVITGYRIFRRKDSSSFSFHHFKKRKKNLT